MEGFTKEKPGCYFFEKTVLTFQLSLTVREMEVYGIDMQMVILINKPAAQAAGADPPPLKLHQ